MIIDQRPGELHTIFNPCIIKVTKGDEDKATLKIAFGIYAELPETYVTIEHEYFNNVAFFDIKRILKNSIEPGITEIVGSTCWIDKELYCEYSVFDDLSEFIYSATAINGVSQIRESSNITDQRSRFMTKFDRLKRYEGYPLDIAAFAFRIGDTFIRFDEEAFTQITANVFVLPITALHYSVEIGNQEDKQFIIPIDNPCVPVNPFYVKWKNQQGGYDYWMFEYRQFIIKSVSNVQTFSPVITDQQNAKGFESTLSIEASEKIRVGATSLSINEYECVSRLIYSPDIQWWNESVQNWVTLIIDKGENEDDTNEILKEVEFTFNLPDPQIQF